MLKNVRALFIEKGISAYIVQSTWVCSTLQQNTNKLSMPAHSSFVKQSTVMKLGLVSRYENKEAETLETVSEEEKNS